MVMRAGCRCGAVALEIDAAPILASSCDCADCREAARIFEKLPDAEPILDGAGGVPYVLFRKDGFRCASGREHLREHRLKDASPTRRVVAVCCNTFMFLDFTKGHWVTLCRDRLEDPGAIAGAAVVDRRSVAFILRLMATWARMGFRTPKIDFVEGRLSVA